MDEKSSCSLQLFFFFDAAAMEDVLVALTMLLLLRVARVGLPPLVGAWRQVTVEELDALHEAASFSFRTRHIPPNFLACKEKLRQERIASSMTACIRQCLLADPTYSWEVLRQSFGPLQDAWLRFRRQHPTCPVHVAATLHVLQRRLGIVRDPSEVEKSAQCWALLDQLSGPEDVAMSPPSVAETSQVQSSEASTRTACVAKPEKRSWSKHAFSLSRLSSDVEIDVEVPVHVSPGEVQLLPTYFRLLQLHQEDGDSGGLAPDVPEWAMTWIDPNFWTLDGLMAFVSSVSAADRELVDTVCGVNSPGDTTAAASAVNHAPAAERPKVLRPTRWGRCLRCKLSLRPHVFKSGQRSGEAYYVCAGFFQKGSHGQDRRCWWSTPVPENKVSELPRFIRNQVHSLPA
jgi:hypothetical protein